MKLHVGGIHATPTAQISLQVCDPPDAAGHESVTIVLNIIVATVPPLFSVAPATSVSSSRYVACTVGMVALDASSTANGEGLVVIVVVTPPNRYVAVVNLPMAMLAASVPSVA